MLPVFLLPTYTLFWMAWNREQVWRTPTGDRARCRIQTGERPPALCAAQRMQFAGAAFNYTWGGHGSAWRTRGHASAIEPIASPFQREFLVLGNQWPRSITSPRESAISSFEKWNDRPVSSWTVFRGRVYSFARCCWRIDIMNRREI